MNRTEQYTLIDGTFDAAEAGDILYDLFSFKINYHERKNFSSQERFGVDDANAVRRLPELRQTLKQIREHVASAVAADKKLIVHSEVLITITEI
ncbi:MAG TPA: hypothetical protein DCG22_10300 [Bacteroidetes bacterium]|nr:hypothetical protein [Bacteroidota bacterium]